MNGHQDLTCIFAQYIGISDLFVAAIKKCLFREKFDENCPNRNCWRKIRKCWVVLMRIRTINNHLPSFWKLVTYHKTMSGPPWNIKYWIMFRYNSVEREWGSDQDLHVRSRHWQHDLWQEQRHPRHGGVRGYWDHLLNLHCLPSYRIQVQRNWRIIDKSGVQHNSVQHSNIPSDSNNIQSKHYKSLRGQPCQLRNRPVLFNHNHLGN